VWVQVSAVVKSGVVQERLLGDVDEMCTYAETDLSEV
jgi:hypothetical protein